jgi:ligand-binding SRPBCC domain-containing protein
MSPTTLRSELAVAAPVEEVWTFFQTAHNLVEMTPPEQRVRIDRGGEVPLHPGLEVRISVSPVPGIRTGWLTRIEEVHPPSGPEGIGWFRDTQLSGPFSEWNHRHEFRPVEGGCLVVDELEYRLPMGRLGGWVAGRWVRRSIESLFAYRSERMADLFGRLTEGIP